MSEDIETTESIRDGYAFNRYNVGTAHGEFDLWYAEEIRKAKEEAWEDGCASGEANEGCGVTGTEDAAENPYRKETE